MRTFSEQVLRLPMNVPCHAPRPPSQALESVAAPAPYYLVGLRYCNVDTSTPGAYNVTFTVANVRSARVSVRRTIFVRPDCADGTKHCNNTCIDIGEAAGLPAL